jgi:integrase
LPVLSRKEKRRTALRTYSDRLLEPLGRRLGLGEGIGWHTFRHSCSSLLRANGTDIKVQQELLRHADVRTTMNIYTQAPSDQKREAHSNVVQMVLKAKAPLRRQVRSEGEH